MEENKLEYEAFCEELLRRLSDTVEESDSIDIQFQQMVKNNGWKRAAIVIRTKEERMTPVIYPDSHIFRKRLSHLLLYGFIGIFGNKNI